MKKLLFILLVIPSLVFASTALYDDTVQTVTNKTIDCNNNTCQNFPGGPNTYTTTFTSGSLTNNQMSLNHALNVTYFSGVQVFDDTGVPVHGFSLVPTDANNAVLNLTGMVVDNTWRVVVSE